MNNKLKSELLDQNIQLCNPNGLLNNLGLPDPLIYEYDENFDIKNNNNFSHILISNKHSLIILNSVIELNPVIVNTLNEDYLLNNKININAINDEILNIRTNLCSYSKKLVHTNNIIYNNVFIIRDELFQINKDLNNIGLELNNKSSLISVPIINYFVPNNLVLNNDNLNINSYIKFRNSIANIFQTATKRNHECIIFDDLSLSSLKIPFEDFFKIIKSLLLEYGGNFKFIIFSILQKNEISTMIYNLIYKELEELIN